MVKAYQKIRDYLQVNDITESELSQRTGLSEKRISSMLLGKGRISIDDMNCICTALETNPQSLLEGRPDNKVFRELVTIVMGLSIENQKYALSFVKGLSKNEGYFISNYRHEAVKRLVMADIPTSEDNIQTYLNESAQYTEAITRGAARIEEYQTICKVKQAIDEGRKAPAEV